MKAVGFASTALAVAGTALAVVAIAVLGTLATAVALVLLPISVVAGRRR